MTRAPREVTVDVVLLNRYSCRTRLLRYAVLGYLAWLCGAIGGCAVTPRSHEPLRQSGSVIAHMAAQLVGTPYRFGGDDALAFDCSGLVVYAHERAGLQVPRTAEAQRRAARPVPLGELLPGDVVFFRLRFHFGRHRADHVGIYAGDGRFIHAPRAGARVSYATLNTGYYRRHLMSAGRFWEGAASPRISARAGAGRVRVQ